MGFRDESSPKIKKKVKRRPKSAYLKKQRKLKKEILNSLNKRFEPVDLYHERGVRAYTITEKYMMKNLYLFFQTIGESELHIERLRQNLAK